MALDLAALRAKLSQLSGDKGNSAIFKPEEGETVVRIVPLSGSDLPFQELHFYYKLIPGKTIMSPLSWNERDPIVEFKDVLLSGARVSKEEFKEIMQRYNPAVRTYVPIIVRGKEKEGIKFWAFGQTIYKQLAELMLDPEVGDITDVKNGYDIKITFTPKEKSDTGFAKTSFTLRPKQCPLTTDKELAEKLLSEQPKLLDVIGYKKHTYDELKSLLERSLSPEAAEAAPTQAPKPTAAEDTEWATGTPTTVKSGGETTKLAADVESEFDTLFNS